jgi:hypothetical protein
MNITFNELRKIKDTLPAGSIKTIADELHISEDTVRNYFGGSHYPSGESIGFHVEQGPDGGVVALDDSTILELAKKIIDQHTLHPAN